MFSLEAERHSYGCYWALLKDILFQDRKLIDVLE